MDLFGGGIGRQERFAERQQQKEMDFAKEQNIISNATKEEQLELLNQETRSNLLRWQQELEDELVNLIHILKGHKLDEFENGYLSWDIPDNPKPICNDKFIEDVVIPQCRPFMSRNLINSNFSEDRILMSLRNTMDDIVDNMADGFDIYDINFQNYDLILRLIKNVICPGSFRALQGWTKKTDSTIFKSVESNFLNPRREEKKRGIFNIVQ